MFAPTPELQFLRTLPGVGWVLAVVIWLEIGDINRYLKWAFIEAASTICLYHQARPHRHVCQVCARTQQRKGHPKAVGAVARHLAEATHWILTKREPYRDPRSHPASSTEGPARDTPWPQDARQLIATSLRDTLMPR